MASPAIPKFDAATLNRATPSGQFASPNGPATSREYLQEGDAFTLVFTLPYKREDIYRELLSPKQLGVDHSTVKISITKRTDQAESEVHQKLQLSARGNKSQAEKNKEQEAILGELSLGCERTVTFPDGVVVSELVELVQPTLIRWKQLSSARGTNMVGKDGGPLPEVTIALDELPNDGGTSIRMTYDFYQILKSDGTPLDGGMMSKLLSQATRGWANDMSARGYMTVDGGAALTGRAGYSPQGAGLSPADLGSTVLRSARRMKDDMDEEARMKAEMLERARAAKKK